MQRGFFCLQALKRGATRVVGIDQDPGFIAKARARAPEAAFLEQSLQDLRPRSSTSSSCYRHSITRIDLENSSTVCMIT